MILPFLYIPVIIKRIGIDTYGSLAASHAIMVTLGVCVQFGYSVYGVKEYIEIEKSNKAGFNAISRLNREILLSKFGIAVLVATFAGFGTVLMDLSWHYGTSFILYCIGEVFNPRWYLQARSMLGSYAKHIVGLRLSQAILIYAFVTDSSNAQLYLLCFSASHAIFMITAYFSTNDFAPVKVKLPSVLSRTKLSLPYFISRCVVTTVDKTPIYLLNLLGLSAAAGIYDLSFKMVSVLQMPANVICQSVYPIALRKKKYSDIIPQIFFLGVFYILLRYIIDAAWPFIDAYFSIDETYFYDAFSLMYFILFANVVSHTIGNNGLLKTLFSYIYNLSVYIAGIFFFIAVVIFYILEFKDIYHAICLYLFYVILVAVIRVAFHGINLTKGSSFSCKNTTKT